MPLSGRGKKEYNRRRWTCPRCGERKEDSEMPLCAACEIELYCNEDHPLRDCYETLTMRAGGAGGPIHSLKGGPDGMD